MSMIQRADVSVVGQVSAGSQTGLDNGCVLIAGDQLHLQGQTFLGQNAGEDLPVGVVLAVSKVQDAGCVVGHQAVQGVGLDLRSVGSVGGLVIWYIRILDFAKKKNWFCISMQNQF